MTGPAGRILSTGLVSALGLDGPRTVQALREGRDGGRPLPATRSLKAPPIPVSEVPELPEDSLMPRADALAMHAVAEALERAGLRAEDLREAGIFLGTVTRDAFESERRYRGQIREGWVPCVTVEPGPGALALRLARSLGVGGPVVTVGSACTSSAVALLMALRAVQQGDVPIALAVGVDLITATLIHGFEALMLLDPEGCRPFDRDRKGIQLGEGAAAILIEAATGSSPRGSLLIGGASRCHPHHLTASDPDGAGAEAVMRAALEDAGLAPEDLRAVKGHGTGTPDNDLAEGRATARVFRGNPPLWTGLKRYLGHTMGASGALETAAMIGCLEEGFVPACLGFRNQDDGIGLSPAGEAAPFPGGPVLLNWFGFGGNSASLVVDVPTREGSR